MARSRDFDALLLDLDGTIIGSDGEIRARTLDMLRRCVASGVRVMVATGRSEMGALPILEKLGLDTEAVVYNGAALYCPRERTLIERRVLPEPVVHRVLDYAEGAGHLGVVMQEGVKLGIEARTDEEFSALSDMTGVQSMKSWGSLRVPDIIRITLFSSRHESSGHFAREVEALTRDPVLLTHFPLSILATHAASRLLVLDIHPDCRGKAEAFRVLEARYGIPAARVVAIGDAANDISMLREAGLGVCMEHADAETRASARRVIGGCDTDAIAELLDELFVPGGGGDA